MKDTLKVGLLGLGIVGTGVLTLLKEHQEKISQVTGMDVVIEKAFVRNLETKQAQAEEYGLPLTTSIDGILEDKEVQIVVELIGTIEPARMYIMETLEKGKHIVTANKDLLAQHGSELVALAQKHHCDLYYEASVAGGIPILRTIANSLAADNIQQVLGIVNSMTNHMLTQMVSVDKSHEEALAKAQALGFAEADPTNDVGGIGAAYKMAILSQFAFGMNVSLPQVDIRGIRGLSLDDVAMAKQLGYEAKLIGSAEQSENSISVEVAPMLVNRKHPIASVRNEYNVVFIKSAGVEESMYYGPGAGTKPTATSVVGGLTTTAKNVRLATTGHMFSSYQHKTQLTSSENVFGQYYFSLDVPDTPGQLLQLTQLMVKAEVGFDQLVQQKLDGQRARIVAVTHQISEARMQQIVTAIQNTKAFQLLNAVRVIGDE